MRNPAIPWSLPVVLAWAACTCRPGASLGSGSQPTGDASATDGASLTPAASSSARAPIDDVRTAFPTSDEFVVLGPWSLGRLIGQVLDHVGGDGGADIAFVFDETVLSNKPRGGEAFTAWYEASRMLVQWSLAANRTRLASCCRIALVECGASAGAWFGEVRVPLTADPYELQRAARHPLARGPQPDDVMMGASWTGLVEAAGLDWQPSKRSHVVLLTDERPHEQGQELEPPLPPADVRTKVESWARRSGATLHLVWLRLEDFHDESPESPDLNPGIEPSIVAATFRDGRASRVDLEGLTVGVDEALARAAEGAGAVDVALIVDRVGHVRLSALRGPLDRFVRTPGHRIALVRWDGPTPTVSVPFSSSPGAVPDALAHLKPGTVDVMMQPVGQTLEIARKLPWSPEARKAIIVLSASQWTGVSDELLDWADTGHVAVTLLDPSTS